MPGTVGALEQVRRPQADDGMRQGLRRGIALALQHVGFDSATEESLESFTATVETYLATFIEHTKVIAEASRREYPTPADFETVLRRHNIPISFLKPHLKNPVAREKLEPDYYDPIPIPENADYFRAETIDFLGEELDGNDDRKDKPWIPKTMPAFPSKHTYKSTMVEAPSQDTQKKRAEASADARKGEKALRRIDRAAKISRHKEAKEISKRNPLSKERYTYWEDMMKVYSPRDASSSDITQEIADHSVIVDYTLPFARKELPRVSTRGTA
ncbi:uncharacterized protein BCR38DRAFT_355897 [Pseudomassariella vexata]|uniref:Transcription initiation factor TFIID subunit 8 n=1 Tax=Pseudomassariella vexata TaxID=1141098 RepID=A0A1Y2DAM8_9PEZI|nr:uncharacterized protein BCR38DRAFT_355897 [Pseudomassariella vexata]ORY56318.1 hypothetical protein BCR38DRAFT_355897 [Pseudomassariella vexata]